MEEKLPINFLQHYSTPKKLLTSVTLLCLGQFKITSTLEWLIFASPTPPMCPKYTKEVFPNSHFDIFKNNCSFLKTSSTFFTCMTCSSLDFLNIRISSNYTMAKSSRNGLNTSFITLMKIVGSFVRLKGITSHSNDPCLVLNEVFQMSSSTILT